MLRVVIRSGMNMEMADLLLDHLREETEFLESLSSPLPGPATDDTPGVLTLTPESFRAPDTTVASRRAAASIAFKVRASSTTWRSRTRIPKASSSRRPTIA